MADPSEQTGPDRVTLGAFGALVLIGGLNFPAVKATVNELSPMWSAGIRFAAAGVLLLGVMLIRHHPFPRGRTLAGVLLFGLLSFAGAYAFAYWAIERIPAGVASVLFASVPLVTLVAAVGHRLEPFRWQTLAGALLSLAGIGVMVGGLGTGSVSVVGLLALLAATICIAEAAVVAKRFPPVPPLVMNAIGMTLGAVFLIGLSIGVGETRAVPAAGATWLGLSYLVLLGSIALFGAYLFVLRRWTASGASYAFVLFPVVAVLFAALFQGERITTGLAVGGSLVVAGVYVGAILHLHRSRGSMTEASEARPEMAGVPADCVRCP